MARRRQEGNLFFRLDVDFFSDRKVKILKARYGADGITLYLYLLCEICSWESMLGDGYNLEVNIQQKTVSVTLQLKHYKNRKVIWEMLEGIVPLDQIIDVIIIYNTYRAYKPLCRSALHIRQQRLCGICRASPFCLTACADTACADKRRLR